MTERGVLVTNRDCETVKIAYRSPQEAWAAACAIRRRKTGDVRRRARARSYRCPSCHLWHITSSSNHGGAT